MSTVIDPSIDKGTKGRKNFINKKNAIFNVYEYA